MKKGITSHTIVRNEDLFIWFAINSVINFVDQMLIYDTGSTDNTIKTIRSIKSKKIIFQDKGEVDADGLVRLRQEQLDRTNTEWLLILDGDEIWWKDSIEKVVDITKNTHGDIWGIITPTINCIGDIYHYQEEKAGKYKFSGRKGHLAVRAIRRTIPGLYISGMYPLEGYRDSRNKLVTDYDDRLIFINKPYLHLTNLSRSSAKSKRVITREKKYELGIPFNKDFHYPEVFYKKYPKFIPSPWKKMKTPEKIIAAIQTPVKKIKRRI